MWIKVHFDYANYSDEAYIQTENICCVFEGNDKKTYITFSGDDTNYFTVKESVEEVKNLIGIKGEN